MDLSSFTQAIARICTAHPQYPPDAYLFLNEGLIRTLHLVQEREQRYRQITGAELADGLRAYALEQFGPLALTVLKHWNIHTTRDFGELVFHLLDAGLLGKTEDDKIEDFDNLYVFEAAFRNPFLPPVARPLPRLNATCPSNGSHVR